MNLHAPLSLTAANLPSLRAARGQVVLVNSSASLRAGADMGAYAASKHGDHRVEAACDGRGHGYHHAAEQIL